MSDEAAREMTLDEYVNRLPASHLASQQYNRLIITKDADTESEKRFNNEVYALGEAIMALRKLGLGRLNKATQYLCNLPERRYPGPAILYATSDQINAAVAEANENA